MSQLGLLEWTPPVVSPRAEEQPRELARVEGALAGFILGWLRSHLEAGDRTFHLASLEEDVECQLPSTPGSAGRILRLLRQSGQVGYRVVSRRSSLYEIEWVR